MIVTLDWLRQYAPLPQDRAALEAAFARLGFGIESVRAFDGDVLWDLEVPSNRPDLQSVIGVARELAIALDLEWSVPAPDIAGNGEAIPVEVLDPDLCPRYVARTIEGVRVRPSPPWLVRRIEAAGLRPVNNIVDVTNFVMLEWGQPLHAFDAARLEGGRIVVRRARAGEQIVTIDGRSHTLDPEVLVIADGHRPVAIAGVMGGRDSEISDGTTVVVLESAKFHAGNIRRTSRRLGLATPSSYRFERGVPWDQVEEASRRAAALIREVASARSVSFPRDVAVPRPQAVRVRIRPERVRRVLGLDVPPEQIARILERAGVRGGVVPDWRPDLRIEEDLIEEIARHVGYDAIPQNATLTAQATAPSRERDAVRRMRAILCGLGAQEANTWSFATPLDDAFAFFTDQPAIGLRDPRGGVERTLRRSVIPALLEAIRVNEGYRVDLQPFFEIGKIYRRRGAEYEEPLVVALVAPGEFPVGRLLADGLFAETRVDAQYEPVNLPFASRGRAALIRIAGEVAGWIAELSADVRARADLRGDVAAAEILFAPLASRARLHTVVEDFARLPAVRRDLSVVVDEGVWWSEIAREAAGAAGGILTRVEYVGEYRGDQIPTGRKSVTLRLIFQLQDRTLERSEADAAVEAVFARLRERFSAVRR